MNDPDRVQVFTQRKVVFIDRWHISNNPADECVIKKDTTKCDEAHILESWTVLPNSSNPRAVLSINARLGEFGANISDPQFLSHHRYDVEGSDPREQGWKIHPEFEFRKFDLILQKRDLVGVFQPAKAIHLESVPLSEADLCAKGNVGISLNGAVDSADLFVSTSLDAPPFKQGLDTKTRP